LEPTTDPFGAAPACAGPVATGGTDPPGTEHHLPRWLGRREVVGKATSADERVQTSVPLPLERGEIIHCVQRAMDRIGLRSGAEIAFGTIDLRLIEDKRLATQRGSCASRVSLGAGQGHIRRVGVLYGDEHVSVLASHCADGRDTPAVTPPRRAFECAVGRLTPRAAAVPPASRGPPATRGATHRRAPRPPRAARGGAPHPGPRAAGR